jgi:hypothetical protein
LQFSNNATFTDMTGSNINASSALTYSDSAMGNINFATVNARYVRLFRASGWFGTGQFRIGQF